MGRPSCWNLSLSWNLSQNHPLCNQRCSCRSHTFLPHAVIGSPDLSSHMSVLSLVHLSSSPLHLTSGMSSGGASASVEFCVSGFDSNIRSCMLFTKSASYLSAVALCVMSCDVSFALSCSVFCIYCSSNLKSRRGHCSLALALLLSQSLLDQSDGVAEGCRALNLQYVHSSWIFIQSCLGVGLMISILLKSMVSLSCALYHSVFTGLNQFLQLDYLVLVFPEVCLHLGWGWAEK